MLQCSSNNACYWYCGTYSKPFMYGIVCRREITAVIRVISTVVSFCIDLSHGLFMPLPREVMKRQSNDVNFNMLNCFKDYKRCILILNRFLVFLDKSGWNQLWNNITCCLSYTTNRMACLLCFGDFRSRSISRHGIDPQSRNILSPASGELIVYHSGVETRICQENQVKYHGCWCPGSCVSPSHQ